MEYTATYTLASGRVAEDRALLRAVYRELGTVQPSWLACQSFVNDDGRQMLFQMATERPDLLIDVDRLAAYWAAIDDRCSSAVTVVERAWDSISTARLTRLGLWNPLHHREPGRRSPR